VFFQITGSPLFKMINDDHTQISFSLQERVRVREARKGKYSSLL